MPLPKRGDFWNVIVGLRNNDGTYRDFTCRVHGHLTAEQALKAALREMQKGKFAGFSAEAIDGLYLERGNYSFTQPTQGIIS